MDHELTMEEVARFENSSHNLLTHNHEYQRRKKSMVLKNQLPKGGCNTCIHTEPHSLFRTWNIWDDSSRPDNHSLLHNTHFITYEFVMSSACDLKCVYCGAHDSSSWAKELGVKVNKGNDLWKQTVLDKLILHLKTREYDQPYYNFFFSGGEPTYNAETLSLIEQIIQLVPHHKLNIVVSTNANTKSKVLEKYLDIIRKYRKITWYFTCSIDDISDRAEAIRYGLSWKTAINNITKLMQEQNVHIKIAPTVNIYSIPHMYEYVKFFYDLFYKNNRVTSNLFTYNMVQEEDLSPMSMPKQYANNLDNAIRFCENHNLDFATHLTHIKNLIGTKIDKHSSYRVEKKWNYFKQRRPNIEWDKLFPFVQDIIEELKLYENTDIRK